MAVNSSLLADTTRKNLVLAGCGIEVPLARGVLLQRNREREIVGANMENFAAGVDRAPAIHLAVCRDEVRQSVLILHRVAGEQYVFGIGAEDLQQRSLIAGLGGSQECRSRIGRRGEGLLNGFFFGLRSFYRRKKSLVPEAWPTAAVSIYVQHIDSFSNRFLMCAVLTTEPPAAAEAAKAASTAKTAGVHAAPAAVAIRTR